MQATGGQGPQPLHSLAFKVMRLCRPAFQVDTPLKFTDQDLDPSSTPGETPSLETTEAPYSHRTVMKDAVDSFGMDAMMILPQSFGTIYLGETFSSYISVGNQSDHAVSNVGIKAELQTERQRTTLYDNTANQLPIMTARGRHDFIVEHDLKELGAHTLVCSTVYTDSDQERRYLPQYFKFTVANPLLVRTKVRHLVPQGQPSTSTLLEACIENCTKHPLFLSTVRFEPSPAYTSQPVELDAERPEKKPLGASRQFLSAQLRKAVILKPGGGGRYYLFQLEKAPDSADADAAGGSTLGKLEIQWRSNLGEPGRLQTQQILGGQAPSRQEVSVKLVSLPPRIVLETPFPLKCRVHNHTAKKIGPLQVQYKKEGGAMGKAGGVVADSLWLNPAMELEAGEEVDVELRLVALSAGVQRIHGVGVCEGGTDQNARVLDTMPGVEIFVEQQ